MCPHLHIARGLSGRIAAVVVIAFVTVGCGETSTPSPVESGYPSDLIHTPVCAAVEDFDDGFNCWITGWPEASGRRPIR